MRAKPFAILAAALLWVALLCLPALAAPGSAAGRKHATKANQLAAQNRCKSAVVEFTKAYKLLKDPALLFNRAECYRKIGKDSLAVKDYQQFLAEMPKAPNRQTIEARIASLRGGAGKGVDKGGASAATPAGDNGTETGSSSGAGAAGIGTSAPAVKEPQPAASLTTQPQVPETKPTGGSRAWVWIGTAVVVAGAGAFVAYHYWPRAKTDVPSTPLGNYAF